MLKDKDILDNLELNQDYVKSLLNGNKRDDSYGLERNESTTERESYKRDYETLMTDRFTGRNKSPSITYIQNVITQTLDHNRFLKEEEEREEQKKIENNTSSSKMSRSPDIYGRGRSRERERNNSISPHRNSSRSRSWSKRSGGYHDRSPVKSNRSRRSPSRSPNRYNKRGRSRSISRENKRDYSPHRHSSKSPHRNRSRSRERRNDYRESSTDRDRNRSRSREKKKRDRSPSTDRHRNRSVERKRSRSREKKDRSPDRYRNRSQDRNKRKANNKSNRKKKSGNRRDRRCQSPDRRSRNISYVYNKTEDDKEDDEDDETKERERIDKERKVREKERERLKTQEGLQEESVYDKERREYDKLRIASHKGRLDFLGTPLPKREPTTIKRNPWDDNRTLKKPKSHHDREFDDSIPEILIRTQVRGRGRVGSRVHDEHKDKELLQRLESNYGVNLKVYQNDSDDY